MHLLTRIGSTSLSYSTGSFRSSATTLIGCTAGFLSSAVATESTNTKAPATLSAFGSHDMRRAAGFIPAGVNPAARLLVLNALSSCRIDRCPELVSENQMGCCMPLLLHDIHIEFHLVHDRHAVIHRGRLDD